MVKRWKIAFYSVLIVFLIFIFTLCGLFYYLLSPAGESELTLDNKKDYGSPMFTVSTTKQQLNRLINQQLQEYEQRESLNLQVNLEDNLAVTGAIGFFDGEIAFEMRFRPVAVENGDLVLIQESFRLGNLLLPEEKILEFIKKGTSLPKWVQILPEEKKIYVALTEIKLENQFYLKAKQINLKKNIIDFSVYRIPENKR